jgi:RHS repeat-associated protein
MRSLSRLALGFALLGLPGQASAQPDPAVYVGAIPRMVTVFSYTVPITVVNGGPVGVQDVTVTVTHTANLTLVSAANPAGSVTIQPNSVIFTMPFLAGFTVWEGVTVQYQPNATGAAAITAIVTPGGSSPANDTSVMSLPVVPPVSTFTDGAQATTDDPISSFGGNFLLTEPPDLFLRGPLPLFVQRRYDSAFFADGVVRSPLGANWQHNYDLTLITDGTNASVTFLDGRLIQFERTNVTQWALVTTNRARSDIGFELVERPTETALTDPRSQLAYFFDAAGRLTRIEDGRGNTNHLAYAGDRLTSVSDGLGGTLGFSYNAEGRLTNVTDGLRSVGYGHTGTNLTRFTDALGHATTYAYDPANPVSPGLMTARTRPEGNTPVTQIFDAAGRVVTQADAFVATTTLSFTNTSDPVLGPRRETTITDPLGFVTKHRYDDAGDLVELVDETDKATAMRNVSGRRYYVSDRLGNLTLLSYDNASGLPLSLTHAGLSAESYFYLLRTNNGLVFRDLRQVNHPDGSSDRYGYDPPGNLIRHTNRASRVWTNFYNARGQLLATTNPAGGVTTFSYDASANLTAADDTDVNPTTFEYDALRRLTNLVHPDATTRRFTYDALDRPLTVTDERGHTTGAEFDDNNRLTRLTNPAGADVRYEYDALDRLVRTIDRLGRTNSVAYEPRGLVAATTNRNGFVTRYEYDARRRLVATIDPGERTNRFEYDDEGVLRAAINPLGERYGIRVDAMGYATALTNPLGQVTSIVRDAMKRVTHVVDPLGHTNRYAYDARGWRNGAYREAPGLAINSTFGYNALGRLLSVFDPVFGFWQFAYTPMGRLTNFSDPLARNTSFQYDARGRPIRTAWPDATGVTNTYDATSNLTRRQFSDGTDLRFAYDALARLTNATGSDPVLLAYDAEGRVTNTVSSGLNFGAAYDAGGRLTQATYRDGLFAVSYTYDSRDRLVAVSDSLSLTSMTFSYDDAGRLTGITRPNGVNTTNTYDAAGRVTRIQDGAILDLQYTWDAAGKLVEADFVAAPIDPTTVTPLGTNTFTYNTASELTTAGYAHDARGRQTNSPAAALRWDAASRLTGIGNVTLGYDALGNLLTRAEPAGTTRYFYNHAIALAPIVAERDEGSGQFRRFYVWSPGGALLYMIDAQTLAVSWPHFDPLGSTLALTDGGGAVTDAYAYSPYGELLAQTGASTQPFRFVGRYGLRHEPAGNLVHIRARYYDPKTARFLSRDPIWPDLSDPKRLNPFSYALNEPTRFVDVDGREPGLATGLLALALGAFGDGVDIYEIRNGQLVPAYSLQDEDHDEQWLWRTTDPSPKGPSILDEFDGGFFADVADHATSARIREQERNFGSDADWDDYDRRRAQRAKKFELPSSSGGYWSDIHLPDLSARVGRFSITPRGPDHSERGVKFGGPIGRLHYDSVTQSLLLRGPPDDSVFPTGDLPTTSPFTLIFKPGGLVRVTLSKQGIRLGMASNLGGGE